MVAAFSGTERNLLRYCRLRLGGEVIRRKMNIIHVLWWWWCKWRFVSRTTFKVRLFEVVVFVESKWKNLSWGVAVRWLMLIVAFFSLDLKKWFDIRSVDDVCVAKAIEPRRHLTLRGCTVLRRRQNNDFLNPKTARKTMLRCTLLLMRCVINRSKVQRQRWIWLQKYTLLNCHHRHATTNVLVLVSSNHRKCKRHHTRHRLRHDL